MRQHLGTTRPEGIDSGKSNPVERLDDPHHLDRAGKAVVRPLVLRFFAFSMACGVLTEKTLKRLRRTAAAFPVLETVAYLVSEGLQFCAYLNV